MVGQEQQTERELSDSFKKIGRLLSENMGIGIADGSDTAKSALEKLNQDLLESQQNYMREKTRIEQAMDEAEEAKYHRDYQIRLRKAKTAEQAEVIRQNEQLRLQKKANEAYLEALETHLKTVEKRVQEQKTRIVSAFNQIAEKAVDSLQALEKAREKMAEKMVNYGGLFETKKQIFLNSGQRGSREVFEHTILDLSQKRAELEQYAGLLGEIQAMGDIPAGLFQSIRGLSIQDAIQYQEALLALGEEQRAAYLADWAAIREMAEQTARDSFAEDTRQALGAVEEELESWYGTIPDSFFEEGTLSAEAFGQAFANKLASMQNMLQQAVESVTSGATMQLRGVLDRMGNVVQNTQNSTTYVLSSAGETVSQQLRSARAHAVVAQLREG